MTVQVSSAMKPPNELGPLRSYVAAMGTPRTVLTGAVCPCPWHRPDSDGLGQLIRTVGRCQGVDHGG